MGKDATKAKTKKTVTSQPLPDCTATSQPESAETGEPRPKWTAKDSVFCDLFSYRKYLLQLYQTLHPEDKETTEDDLESITIKKVLMNGLYNDLGFLVGDVLLALIEAQSTWKHRSKREAFLGMSGAFVVER